MALAMGIGIGIPLTAGGGGGLPANTLTSKVGAPLTDKSGSNPLTGKVA